VTSSHPSPRDAPARWRDQLAAWAIPAPILAAAPESPYGFPVDMFGADAQPGDTPSRRRSLEKLPRGGSVIDVGCGGGQAGLALVPPAARVVGVDSSADMLAAFARAAEARAVDHAEVAGSWPDVAAQAGRADVVVAHHVLYNVPDLAGFASALTGAARNRVVVELTDTHPWVPTNHLWRRFHDLERPAGPTAELAVAALRALGLAVEWEYWERPARRVDRPATVAFVRRRLCLPAACDAEVDAALPADYEFAPRRVATLWWDGAAEAGKGTGGAVGARGG
jgi:SAM-dependent methyltransferase